MSTLIFMDVIRSGEVPVREARVLYEALMQADPRIVIAITQTEALAEHWLMVNGIRGYANLISPLVDLGDGTPLWQRQIEVARTAGHLDLVVTSNPDVVAWGLEHGQTCLLFAHPVHTSPAFRPDVARRTWAQIETQLTERKAKEWVAHE